MMSQAFRSQKPMKFSVLPCLMTFAFCCAGGCAGLTHTDVELGAAHGWETHGTVKEPDKSFFASVGVSSPTTHLYGANVALFDGADDVVATGRLWYDIGTMMHAVNDKSLMVGQQRHLFPVRVEVGIWYWGETPEDWGLMSGVTVGYMRKFEWGFLSIDYGWHTLNDVDGDRDARLKTVTLNLKLPWGGTPRVRRSPSPPLPPRRDRPPMQILPDPIPLPPEPPAPTEDDRLIHDV